MAEDRVKFSAEEEKSISLKSTEAHNLLQRVAGLRKLMAKLKTSGDPKSLFQERQSKYNKVSEAILEISEAEKPNKNVADVTKAIASNGPRCILSLDDAVTVLRSLAQTESKSDHVITKAEVDSAVDLKVRSFFSHQAGNEFERNWTKDRGNRKTFETKRKFDGPSSSKNSSKKGPLYPKGKRFKLSDLVGNSCMDCGSTQHIRGDSECKHPSFATRKLREAKSKQEDDSSDGETPSNQEGYFIRAPSVPRSKEPRRWNSIKIRYPTATA